MILYNPEPKQPEPMTTREIVIRLAQYVVVAIIGAAVVIVLT